MSPRQLRDTTIDDVAFQEFEDLVVIAQSANDIATLRKLQQDISQAPSLTDNDWAHLVKLIYSSIAKITGEAPEANLTSSGRPHVTPAIIEEHSIGSKLLEQATNGRFDLLDVPMGDTTFEHCYRAIIFAHARGDSFAVDGISQQFYGDPELTHEQRSILADAVAAFRSTFGHQIDSPATDGELKMRFSAPTSRALQAADGTPNAAVEVDRSAPETEEEVADTHGAQATIESATGSAVDAFQLPPSAAGLFSPDYVRIRKRYLDFFFFEGMSPAELDVELTDDHLVLSKEKVSKATFADQTLHMGQAMLLFAGEAQLLKLKGQSPASSEAAIEKLLDAYDLLDAADQKLYGASKSGFFVRDVVHNDNKMGVPLKFKSDMQESLDSASKSQNAMSLDQTVSLFVGWWAISKWSTKGANIKRAKSQIDSVMDFLMDSKFLIRTPDGGGIPTDRGSDFRYAAGFLCRMAEATSGKSYFGKAKIDITIKGDPVRIRDDNLGEFELPGFKIPADMPVALSHAAILRLAPLAFVALTAPPKIAIRISDLFPGEDKEINLPCAHMVQAHPEGHKVKIPCTHLVPEHPEGHPGPKIPCVHMVPKHPEGDKVPCLHLTAKHPGGDPGPTIPCTHFKKQHDHDWVKVGPLKTQVPCTHIVQKHPGGHKTKVPCIHLVPAHPEGHTVPCIHLTAKHPEGDETTLPCPHLVQAHPEGHEETLPCLHIVQAHPSGHGFDLRKLDIEIPLGDKLHSYSRHIALQCMAFEPVFTSVLFLPAALNSDHIWSALLRRAVLGDISVALLSNKAKQDHAAIQKEDGPSNIASGPWVRSNRWERCTELGPDAGGPYAYNGLDFLSLEVLMRLGGVLS